MVEEATPLPREAFDFELCVPLLLSLEHRQELHQTRRAITRRSEKQRCYQGFRVE